ncbi:ExeA family protein [Gimesia panareensis]|uniref:ExeA family protein n=1 Tax=Gimesia panareensis TaxID=2527978 RepID=UPI0018D994C4|nr:AAA family ATPase [Gimesia panareensis]
MLDEILVTISSLNGITILTGDAGTGKTAVCRQLITRLEDQFQIQFLEHCNFPTIRALLQTLLYGLTDCYEKISEQELRLALTAEIRSSFLVHGQPLLVIVDEAHLLGIPFLEELRVLSDIAFDGKPAVQLLLSGQTALEETLIQPNLSSLNQRIGCQTYLDRMTRQESEEYIEYRLNRVSTESSHCFSEDAIKFITHVSDGLPRCLNQICDHSLMLAYMQDVQEVDEAIAREAFSDLQQLPLHWNDPLPAPSPLDVLRKKESPSDLDQFSADETMLEHDIDDSIEERLNQLMEESPEVSAESVVADDDWDSEDLFSFGEGLEAIEIGSQSEPPQPTEPLETVEAVTETELEAASPDVLPEPDVNPVISTITETTGDFIEIIDRYAAIDAGLDPVTLFGENHQALESSNSVFQLRAPEFHYTPQTQPLEASVQHKLTPGTEESETEREQAAQVSAGDSQLSLEGSTLEFEEGELKKLEPGVFQELAAEASRGEGTFEELLAAQVYEVCSETRKGLLNALNEIRNYTVPEEEEADPAEVYDIVLPETEDEFPVEQAVPEWSSEPDFSRQLEAKKSASVRVDAPARETTNSSATAHLKGPALGRYKNLFSRLRRKQDSHT